MSLTRKPTRKLAQRPTRRLTRLPYKLGPSTPPAVLAQPTNLQVEEI